MLCNKVYRETGLQLQVGGLSTTWCFNLFSVGTDNPGRPLTKLLSPSVYVTHIYANISLSKNKILSQIQESVNNFHCYLISTRHILFLCYIVLKAAYDTLHVRTKPHIIVLSYKIRYSVDFGLIEIS